MRRLLATCAVSTACLLANYVGVPWASEPAPAAKPQPALVQDTTPGPRPTLSLVTFEAPADTPTPSVAVPAQYLPPASPAPAKAPIQTITLSETIITTTLPGTIPAPRPAITLPTETAMPPSGMSTAFPRAEPLPGRKSYVDLTASPCFAHAPDYNWIYGRVEYSSVTKEWRLRYASVDETDRYGGRVALIENHQAGLLRDGMFVHVRGHIVNPDNTAHSSTYYRIEWFKAIDDPNTEQAPPASMPPLTETVAGKI